MIREILTRGGVGVLPTDTLYGLCGSALNSETVERIYRIRKRNLKKPLIVLIGDLSQLKLFGVRLGSPQKQLIGKLWPGKVSIVFPVPLKKFAYLHRGTKTIAFRWPKKKILERLLKLTGPQVAPSANPEGEAPAQTIQKAKIYFGTTVDFYESGGTRNGKSSTLITLKGKKVIVLREGAVKIPAGLV